MAGPACGLLRRVGNTSRRLVVCSETCCDDKIDFDWPETRHQVFWLQSTKAGQRFQFSEVTGADEPQNTGTPATASPTPPPPPPPPSPIAASPSESVDFKIKINLSEPRHEVFGFGGAFTDAFGAQLDGLSQTLRDKLLNSYFGKDGLHYTFGRVPIGGSDFSVRPYTYDDTSERDFNLSQWKLAQEDREFKMPYISKAMALVESQRKELKLIASPWSPPAWMKTNNNLVRGHLIDEDRIYKAYADYLMRFLEAYENNGITFWAMTVQNEPIASFLPFYFFNSLQFKASSLAKFLGKYLGPALEQARGWTRESGLKIIVGDDSLGLINAHVPAVLDDPDAAKYASGLGFHWYLSGFLAPYSLLDQIHEQTKDKLDFTIMTEACTGSSSAKKVDLGSWSRGEAYFEDIVQDLERHTNAWIDWNMALDTHGGPNWAQNFVDSPIIVDNAAQEFWKQPMYYAIGHFSRVFQPGTRLLNSRISKSFWQKQDLVAIAGINEQSQHVVINVLNKSGAKRKIRLSLLQELDVGPIELEPKSMNSFLIKL